MNPKDGYISYIVNPKSGARASSSMNKQFEHYLSESGYDVRVSVTRHLEDAYEFATDAAVDFDCGLVVAAGGDGTIREVAHGLEGSDTSFLIVPCGTENLLANEFGFDEKITTVISTFEEGQVRRLDLGCVNGRCFTSVVGVGFDGEVVHRVSCEREGHIDYLDYFWPIWRTFWNYKFEPLRVEVDGDEVFDGRGIVIVGNISKYALGLGIAKNADYNDGRLDVCVYKCGTQLGLARHSLMTIFKHHVDSTNVIYRQCAKVRVSSKFSQVKSEIDGDPGPELPIEIEVIPDAVGCLVPRDSRPAGIRTRLLRALG